MIDKPMFKSCYHVEVVEPDTVILLSERGHQSLRGRLYYLLAPLIDGSRSVGEIVRQLEGQALPVEVFHALMRLKEKGYLSQITIPSVPPISSPREPTRRATGKMERATTRPSRRSIQEVSTSCNQQGQGAGVSVKSAKEGR